VSPVFAHGQLRLYLLALLDEAPRHGYEVIRALEERFGGLYSPSAGSVYPRLARLEDEGLVSRTDEGRTAVYRITDAGRGEVRERADDVSALQRDLDDSVRRLAAEVRSRVRADAEDLRAELKRAAREARRSATEASSEPSRARGADVRDDVQDVLASLRGDLRRWDPDDETLTEVLAVLESARRRVRELLDAGGRTSDGGRARRTRDH
jgi:DNA-binding PadR family transcriptional regulator